MTIRRWVTLFALIAALTVQASHLPLLAGEITASAAKVFLHAAKADEKTTTDSPSTAGPTLAPAPTVAPAVAAAPTSTPAPAPTLAPTPAPAATPLTLEAQSAAATPPTLEDAAVPESPNVLRPTPDQLEARVTPTTDEAAGGGSRSSRRAPTSLPLPTLGVSQTASPTLAPPKPLAPVAPEFSPAPEAQPLLVAEKPKTAQELKPAAAAPAVTNNFTPTPAAAQPTVAPPALLTPSPMTAKSVEPATLPSATQAPATLPPATLPSATAQQAAPPADHSIGYDATTGKTYRNALRGGTTTSVPTPAPTPAAKPHVVELTPSFQSSAKPLANGSPTTAQPRTGSYGAQAPAAVATDAPSRSATNPGVRPNAMLNPDEEPTQRAVVSKAPAAPESQKLFESQEQPFVLTPEHEALKRRVQRTLASYYQNWTLNTREHSPWEVMHAIIAYGVDTKLVTHSGQPTTAIGHLCFSGVCNKQQIVTVTKSGRLYMNRGPGVQGHAGQFLAIVAQSQLQRDYPLYAGGKEFTMEDLIKAEQYDCESGTELTFKLIGLMHYLPSDAEWTNFQGQKWSLDRLVREEIVQPVRGAACGGTHRLMGLSYAVRKREQRGEPITGIYKEAERYIAQYHKYTRGLQNPDGSFSTAWFVRREARLDLDRRLQTTGHVLEWLCFSLNDEQLREPWVTKTVTYVTNLLLEENHEWQIGHLGHALHALQMYNERMYGGPIRSYEGMVSRRPIKTAKQVTPSTYNE